MHMVVIIAVPSYPRKLPKKSATELPSKGKKTISRYIRSSLFQKKSDNVRDIVQHSKQRKYILPKTIPEVPSKLRKDRPKNQSLPASVPLLEQ
jgi:predicted site-specific integrase-resolvase